MPILPSKRLRLTADMTIAVQAAPVSVQPDPRVSKVTKFARQTPPTSD